MKYKMGDKIIFKDVHSALDGKSGTFVCVYGGLPRVHIQSHGDYSKNKLWEDTYVFQWEHITKVSEKGKQLLFSFMEE